MDKKLTWKAVYKNFKSVYPRLHKMVKSWHPHSYATILIFFEDGNKATYNYDEGRLKFLKGD